MSILYCLKCGCETKAGNVFCDACLQDMAMCPVRSDAVIQLPERTLPEPEKKSKKKRSYAAYVRTLRGLIRALCVAVVLLTLLVCALSYFLLDALGNKPEAPSIGKNYTTTEQTNAP